VNRYILVLTILAFGAVGFAQNTVASRSNVPRSNDTVAAPNAAPAAGTDCLFQFASGVNNTFLRYCVAANGNIVELETPLGQKQVSVDRGEGYGVCDVNTGVSYYDYGGNGNSGNWGTATVVSHNATSVKIARTTADGLWTLTQTITQVAGTVSAKVTMALKNNSGAPKTALLMRYANVDAGGIALNNLDGTINSAYASNSTSDQNHSSSAFGLTLQNIGTSLFPYEGFVQNGPQGPVPCNFRAFFAAGPLLSTDGSLVMIYQPSMNAHAAATVTVGYKGL